MKIQQVLSRVGKQTVGAFGKPIYSIHMNYRWVTLVDEKSVQPFMDMLAEKSIWSKKEGSKILCISKTEHFSSFCKMIEENCSFESEEERAWFIYCGTGNNETFLPFAKKLFHSMKIEVIQSSNLELHFSGPSFFTTLSIYAQEPRVYCSTLHHHKKFPFGDYLKVLCDLPEYKVKIDPTEFGNNIEGKQTISFLHLLIDLCDFETEKDRIKLQDIRDKIKSGDVSEFPVLPTFSDSDYHFPQMRCLGGDFI